MPNTSTGTINKKCEIAVHVCGGVIFHILFTNDEYNARKSNVLHEHVQYDITPQPLYNTCLGPSQFPF